MRTLLGRSDSRAKASAGTSEIERIIDLSARTLEVVLVDPLHTVRAGLDLLIRTQEDMKVVAQSSTSDGTVADLQQLGRTTDVLVVLGLGLTTEHDSFWLIRRLRELFPPVRIVAVGANSDRGAISRAFFTGADGFIDKNAEPEEFLGGLRRAFDGEVVMVGPPANWIGSIALEVGRQRDAGPVLTQREQEVMVLAAEGLTAKDMGGRLGLSDRTVTTHLHRIYSKLGVSSRVAAVQAASKQGLITAPELS